MIEKMSFVTLAGPKTEIDYLVDHYLSKHDIHLGIFPNLYLKNSMS